MSIISWKKVDIAASLVRWTLKMYSLPSSAQEPEIVVSEVGAHWISRSASGLLKMAEACSKVCVSGLLPEAAILARCETLVYATLCEYRSKESYDGGPAMVHRQCRTRSRRGQLWTWSTRSAATASRSLSHILRQMQLLAIPLWCSSVLQEREDDADWPSLAVLTVVGNPLHRLESWDASQCKAGGGIAATDAVDLIVFECIIQVVSGREKKEYCNIGRLDVFDFLKEAPRGELEEAGSYKYTGYAERRVMRVKMGARRTSTHSIYLVTYFCTDLLSIQ